jgi:hypothetical protein
LFAWLTDNIRWFKRMELIEVKSLIWAQKGKLYIIYENVMWILGILRFKSIHLLFYNSSYCCFLASELSIVKKIKYSRQATNSQSMGFAINISHAAIVKKKIWLWSSSVIRIVKMKYNRIDIKWQHVSTSFKIYLEILSYFYITFTIFVDREKNKIF